MLAEEPRQQRAMLNPCQKLRVRDAVTQLQRGEGQVNEHVEGEKIIQTDVLRSPRVTLGPTVRFVRSAFCKTRRPLT